MLADLQYYDTGQFSLNLNRFILVSEKVHFHILHIIHGDVNVKEEKPITGNVSADRQQLDWVSFTAT